MQKEDAEITDTILIKIQSQTIQAICTHFMANIAHNINWKTAAIVDLFSTFSVEREFEVSTAFSKIVHPKMKIMSLFSHPASKQKYVLRRFF